ncbi:MAG: adenylate/guanylate cyclase domain-containing protein [bacterium]|nr:adenylate/guanylate cyclase domain-containing protein [bacterium]
MKILAVDDKPDNIELIVDIISALDHDVRKAFNGPQALAAVAIDPPDLIILDVNMPGMSGFEVVTHLKSNPLTAQIPVIMLTALSDVENRVEGLGLGADDYLTKPFNARELIARVEARLRAKSETDHLRSTQEIIRRTFERFVSPSVVHQLLDDPASVRLGGRLQEVTVFFADLQGFTTISEHTDPEQLLTVLNLYHELMVQIVQDHGGTMDKFIGDAIMALYNTPLNQPDHALQAVLTAHDIRSALRSFHPQFEPQFRMNINFGIHTGMAVVGNVGAPQLMDFTAVGDTVNVAARLQQLSDGGQILISQATYECLHHKVEVHPLGQVTFKGRREPVTTYEVLSVRA